jgi:Rrf2 family protein
MLSQKARYALHATIFLAKKDAAASVAEIAESEAIPRKFLESIMQDLKQRNIVTSRRGPSGGYSLARPAERISFAEVVRGMDGPLALAPCASQTAFRPCPDCKSIETCEIRLLEGMSLSEAAGKAGVSFINPN